MTLLELIVVMALLGLLLALVAPSFAVPDAARRDDLASIIATARRAAVLRAEPVTLSVDETGKWEVHGKVASTSSPIARGTLEEPVGRLRVHLTPLGTCVLELLAGATMPTWDPIRCGPATDTRDVSQRP